MLSPLSPPFLCCWTATSARAHPHPENSWISPRSVPPLLFSPCSSGNGFLLNIPPCSLLCFSLVSCRPLPEETGMESLGSPTEDETTSCKYQPPPEARGNPGQGQQPGREKALDPPQKNNKFLMWERKAGGI